MILIITHKEDFTADFLIEKLNRRKISYYRLNCEDLDKLKYKFGSGTKYSFNIQGLDNVSSIWFRRTKLPDLKIENEFEKLYLLEEYNSLLENIYSLLKDKKWISYPKSIYEAENKLLQLKLAKEIGFNIPKTLLTSEHSELIQFYKENNEDIIIKPLHQGRIKFKENIKTIFTNQIGSNFIENIEDYDLTPSIFQENIQKSYEIRVTVVGVKVFAVKINSQNNEETKIDWRKRKLPSETYDLPLGVMKKCVLLVKKLNLSFGAIDIIKKPNGQYIFLEINPNGQWAWLEMENKLEISTEIINLLTSNNVD